MSVKNEKMAVTKQQHLVEKKIWQKICVAVFSTPNSGWERKQI